MKHSPTIVVQKTFLNALKEQLGEAEGVIERIREISNDDLYNDEIVEQIDLALIEYFKNKDKK